MPSAVPPQFAALQHARPDHHPGLAVTGSPVPVYFPQWISSAILVKGLRVQLLRRLSAGTSFSISYCAAYYF